MAESPCAEFSSATALMFRRSLSKPGARSRMRGGISGSDPAGPRPKSPLTLKTRPRPEKRPGRSG